MIIGKLETYANESKITLQLIENYLKADERMLEVGAGLCLTSLFLKSRGYRIVALEPVMGGFDIFEQLQKAVLDHYANIELEVLDRPAQELSAESNGHFQFIFSNNVIEHIPLWRNALLAMLSVLDQNGVMVHTCPNYTIPYEPHFGIPVLRRFPKLSSRLFAKRIALQPGVWKSLNFLTYRQVVTFFEDKDVSVSFVDELLFQALRRLETDPLFRARHQGPLVRIYQLLKASRLLQLIRKLPPSWTTPMVFSVHKPPVSAEQQQADDEQSR